MSAQQPAQPAPSDERARIANALLSDWNTAMDRFFEAVDAERKRRGLTDEAMADALAHGYGGEVADGWREWIEA